MENNDDKKFNEIIERLASNSKRWLEIRAILLDDMKGNQEIIRLIDKKVKENELKITKLN